MRERLAIGFIKMHGTGNDFIVVDGRSFLPVTEEWLKEKAPELCNRHFGIGADGILVILPSERADARMRIFNPDKSEAESCGNGIRCVARVLACHQGHQKGCVSIETLAGVQAVTYERESDGNFRFTVDMGPPILEPERIPTLLGDGRTALNVPIFCPPAGSFVGHCVSMGNPHLVIFAGAVDELPLERVGPFLENHPAFPKRTNVEFVEVLSRDRLRVRVWERGAGITLACGTGACASVVAAILTGRTDNTVTVSLPGGDLTIQWNGEGGVLMNGPAVEVFRGEVSVTRKGINFLKR